MKKLPTLLIVLLFSNFFLAQTSGYLGKRFSFGFRANIFPEIIKATFGADQTIYKLEKNEKSYYNYVIDQTVYVDNYNITREDNPNSRMSLNLTSEANLNYCLNNNVEISLKMEYLNNSFVFKNYQSSGTEFVSINPIVDYKTFNYNINLKFYRLNFIAPVGKFVTVGIGISQSSTRNNEDFELAYLQEEEVPGYYTYKYTPVFINANNKARAFKFNLGIGNNIIINQNLYFSYLLETNYYTYKASEFGYKADNLFEYNLSRDLIVDNIFNLKVGLGIIL